MTLCPKCRRGLWIPLCAAAFVSACLQLRTAECRLQNAELSDKSEIGNRESETGLTPEPGGEPFLLNDGTLDVDAAVKYFEDLYRSTQSIATAELIVTRPGRTRSMRMKSWTRGTEKALVVILSPLQNKGIATLKVEKNLWNYFPNIKRTIRIPPSMMLTSWMGSDFTNDDLVRESSYSEDYSYKLAGRSEDPTGWRVEFQAKPDTVGLWERIELVLSVDGKIPIVAKYYDRKGRLARTLYWDAVKVFDGRRIPSHMTLIPEDKEGHKTELMYQDIDFDVSVPDSTFSLSELERER